jgi:hypothetical protein
MLSDTSRLHEQLEEVRSDLADMRASQSTARAGGFSDAGGELNAILEDTLTLTEVLAGVLNILDNLVHQETMRQS